MTRRNWLAAPARSLITPAIIDQKHTHRATGHIWNDKNIQKSKHTGKQVEPHDRCGKRKLGVSHTDMKETQQQRHIKTILEVQATDFVESTELGNHFVCIFGHT